MSDEEVKPQNGDIAPSADDFEISDKIQSAYRIPLDLAAKRGLTEVFDIQHFDQDTEVNNEYLLKKMDEKLAKTLHYMDEATMQDAPLTSLTRLFTALLDRRQLLRGEPTQIVSNTDRRALTTLLPQLLEEARRRGLTVPFIEPDYEVIENG